MNPPPNLTEEERRILETAGAILQREGQPITAGSIAQLLEDPVEKAKRWQAYYDALHAASSPKPSIRYFLSEEAIELGLEPPKTAYAEDAGLDLRLCYPTGATVQPGERKMIPTGLGFEIPTGWWGHIRSRTSMGKKGLIPAAQVVDSNFTGHLTICLVNVGNEAVVLEAMERCAQIVFMPHMDLSTVERIEAHEIKKTDRGSGAFGSSGRH